MSDLIDQAARAAVDGAKLVPARDVLNQFSRQVAEQTARLLTLGMSPEHLIAMYLDHAAGVISLTDSQDERDRQVNAAAQRLRSFVHRKAVQRRRGPRLPGLPH